MRSLAQPDKIEVNVSKLNSFTYNLHSDGLRFSREKWTNNDFACQKQGVYLNQHKMNAFLVP